MSRNFAVLGKSAAPAPAPYAELIRRVFQNNSVLAVVGAGSEAICEDIASELAATGKRNVIVQASHVGLTTENTIQPGANPNIWYWPTPPSRQIDFFKAPYPLKIDPENWLDFLRQNFDRVLLTCQPQNAEIAAQADIAVLVVEAGKTPKHQIQQDQRTLQSKSVNLAGSILIRPR